MIAFMLQKKSPPLAKKEIRDTPLSLKIKPSLKTALEQAAAADNRSTSQYVELLLTDAMRERGFLK